MMKVFALLACLFFAIPALCQKYTLADNWSGANFLDNFSFWTSGDPTHGYVHYVSQADAQANGLINITGNTVHLYSDHTKVATSPGRMSIRISSKKTYTDGLFILDLSHMPTGCGTWPAFWMCGPSWPNGGEIDIIEGVNTQAKNAMTLHTSNGCTMQGITRKMTGTASGPDCWISDPKQPNNAGCGVNSPSAQSYGAGLNANNGGVFATQWTAQGINIWFFPRQSIPADVTSPSPNPSSWPTPDAAFPFGTNCPASHFTNNQIIFDNTFCGDWAGNTFAANGCPGSCQSYVQNNPSAFTQAYWSINYLKTFQGN